MPVFPGRRLWTPEEDARIAELRADGRTDAEVGVELNRTTEAVTTRRHWLRGQAAKTAPAHYVAIDSLGRRAWTPNDDQLLSDLRRQNESDEVIAAALDRSVAAVQNRVCKLRLQGDDDIPLRKCSSQWTPERVSEARAMRDAGLTPHQIARRLGTDAATVGRALRSTVAEQKSPDHVRTAAAVEEARAALARAEARHREAIDPILAAVREAIVKAGFVDGPDGDDGDGEWPSPEWLVLDHLRRQGLELRRVG